MFSCNTAGRGKGGMREGGTTADSSTHVQLQHGGKGEGGNEGGREGLQLTHQLMFSCNTVGRGNEGGREGRTTADSSETSD